LNRAEPTAPAVAFDLIHHSIEVSLLVFRPASDMRAVQENRQRRRIFGSRLADWLSLRVATDVPGNFG